MIKSVQCTWVGVLNLRSELRKARLSMSVTASELSHRLFVKFCTGHAPNDLLGTALSNLGKQHAHLAHTSKIMPQHPRDNFQTVYLHINAQHILLRGMRWVLQPHTRLTAVQVTCSTL